jgi:NAD(P)-dependent dehydrogenase (short-subunit alcohol dehydrogenase family)
LASIPELRDDRGKAAADAIAKGTPREGRRFVLNGKVAIVTGSTSGIGLGIARALAVEGCRVALNGRRASDETERLRAEIAAASGTDVVFRRADVSRPDDIYAMVEAVAGELGPVDILVNNAGVQHVAPIVEFSSEAWDTVLAINLSSAFHCTKAVLPAMRARKWASTSPRRTASSPRRSRRPTSPPSTACSA